MHANAVSNIGSRALMRFDLGKPLPVTQESVCVRIDSAFLPKRAAVQ